MQTVQKINDVAAPVEDQEIDSYFALDHKKPEFAETQIAPRKEKQDEDAGI